MGYAVAVYLAVEANDPTYLSEHPQFSAFLAWNIDRSMRVFEPCAQIPDFAYDVQDEMLVTLRTHPDAEELRRVMKHLLGETRFSDYFSAP